MKQESTTSMTDMNNYEAIGRCVHLRSKITGLVTARYRAIRELTSLDVITEMMFDGESVYFPDMAALRNRLDEIESVNTELKALVDEHNKWALHAGRPLIKDTVEKPRPDFSVGRMFI